ncbi:hypothetical protein HK099_000038 [Clydaea vesicula]|uniref:GS catalytic domain-containing protein n=1 Tax=Clydaea vesicula TaxID=447962 RepID=A0AAD5Y4C0_9FUNG|nr:hypothetical protein HK099_000038 [Clydaea vesicula]
MSKSHTLKEIQDILKNETKIKLSGSDIDGITRGKVVNKDKAVKSLDAVDFYDPVTNLPLDSCPRGLLKKFVHKLSNLGYKGKVLFHLLSKRIYHKQTVEWSMNETPETLFHKKGVNLDPLTRGMFGYSVTRTTLNKEFFHEIYDRCLSFDIPIEGLHTETGPGVYEAALYYSDALNMADRAHLFKTTVKQIGLEYGITSCFMAKPYNDLPGCSGHIHVSLASLTSGENLFSAVGDTKNPLTLITPLMKNFLAGILLGLPSMMACYAPVINSYKRLVENYWAPVTVTYGFENRTAAIRLICPPLCPPSATRLEMRVTAIAAILGSGLYGIEHNLELPFGPLEGDAVGKGERLPRNLKEASETMKKKDSIARKVFGDNFVDHFTSTRDHEWALWERQVTSWEVSRYMETV